MFARGLSALIESALAVPREDEVHFGKAPPRRRCSHPGRILPRYRLGKPAPGLLLDAAFFTRSLRALKVSAGTAVSGESNHLGHREVSFFLGHVHRLADGRQSTDAVKQHVAGRSRYAKEVLLFLRGRRGCLGLVFGPNVNLDGTRPLRIQFGAELRDLLLSSLEARMEGFDQCFAVVV